MNSFESIWSRYYRNRLPLRFDLRGAETSHWVRFHALPRSKRYAESEVERQVILTRMNTLALRVLGENTPCWMVEADGATAPARANPHGLAFLYCRHLDEIDWNFRAGLTTWQEGRFDTQIAEIADDCGPVTLWMSTASGAVFSPYDGGADMFLPTTRDAMQLRTEFAAWLSPRPDGM